MFCPLGAMKLGVEQKKVTASDSAKPGPHIHIFFLSQGSRVSVEMGTKSEKVCVCWRLFHLVSPRSMVTFCSNLVW